MWHTTAPKATTTKEYITKRQERRRSKEFCLVGFVFSFKELSYILIFFCVVGWRGCRGGEQIWKDWGMSGTGVHDAKFPPNQ